MDSRSQHQYQQRLDSQMQQQTAGQWWQQQQQPQLFQQQQQPQFAPTAPTLIQHPQYPQLQYPQLQYPQPHHHQITPPAAFSGHHRSQSQHAINPYHYANVPARSFIASASQQIVPQQCSAGDMGAAEPTTPKRQAVAAPVTGAATSLGSPLQLSRPSPHKMPQRSPQRLPLASPGLQTQGSPQRLSLASPRQLPQDSPQQLAHASPLQQLQDSPQQLSRASPQQQSQPQPQPPSAPHDPAIWGWARKNEEIEYQRAAALGKGMGPRQRQERIMTLYRYGLEQKRAAEAKQGQEQFRQIEDKRNEEKMQAKKEAEEQACIAQAKVKERQEQIVMARRQAEERVRIAQKQESDRLAQIQIAQRQEETRQREESRNNARLIAATEKQRRELLRRNEVAENERQEAARISAAAALERQRRAKRKAELQRDPDRNFHSYLECLEFWPLAKGESQNTYMRSLMANQRMPLDEDTDTAIAVKFAKKHYNWYREYPRDVALCVKEAKEEEEKEKAAVKA